jgi:hypothetical protein
MDRRRYYAGLLVVLAAALTRFAHLAEYLFSSRSHLYYWPVLAAAQYRDQAVQMAAGIRPAGGFTYADPAYVYMLAASFLTGLGAWPLLVLQLASGIVTAWLVYRLALTAGSDVLPAAAAGLAYALYAPAAFYELTLLSVAWVSMLVALFVWLFCTRLQSRLTAFLLGLIPGMMAGLRPQLIPLLALPLIVLAWRRSWRGLALLAAGFLLPVLLLSWQQHARGGPFSPVSTSFGFNLFIGNNPDANGFSPSAPSSGIVEDLRRDIHQVASDRAAALGFDTRAGADAYYRRIALEWIAANPLRALRLTGVKWAAFFGFRAFDSYYEMGRVNRFAAVFALGVPRWLLMLFFALALAPFIRGGRMRAAMLLPVALALATDFLSNHTERYSLPVTALVCTVAGAGTGMLIRQIRAGQWKRAVACLPVAALLLAPTLIWPVPAVPEGMYIQSMAIRAYQAGEYDQSLALFERAAIESEEGSCTWVTSHAEAARIAGALGDMERMEYHQTMIEEYVPQ